MKRKVDSRNHKNSVRACIIEQHNNVLSRYVSALTLIHAGTTDTQHIIYSDNHH